jgi:CheY-like chemotaxis protein
MVRDEPTDTGRLRALSVAASKAAKPLRMNILVVEDNSVNQEVARGMLQHLGCVVTIAGDGASGVKAFETSQFDAVLMDCHMPALDGYAATRRIREFEAQQRRARTPIIALTANALSDDAEKCLAAGMDSYLSKPYTLKQLRSVLDPRQNAIEAPESVLDGPALDAIRQLEEQGAG